MPYKLILKENNFNNSFIQEFFLSGYELLFKVNVSHEFQLLCMGLRGVKSLCPLGNQLLVGGLLLSPISMRLQSKVVKLCNISRRRNPRSDSWMTLRAGMTAAKEACWREKHKTDLANWCQLSCQSKKLPYVDRFPGSYVYAYHLVMVNIWCPFFFW